MCLSQVQKQRSFLILQDREHLGTSRKDSEENGIPSVCWPEMVLAEMYSMLRHIFSIMRQKVLCNVLTWDSKVVAMWERYKRTRRSGQITRLGARQRELARLKNVARLMSRWLTVTGVLVIEGVVFVHVKTSRVARMGKMFLLLSHTFSSLQSYNIRRLERRIVKIPKALALSEIGTDGSSIVGSSKETYLSMPMLFNPRTR